MTAIRMRTAAWYGDKELELPAAPNWRVQMHSPRVPAPLTEVERVSALRSPAAGPRLAELATGSRRPIIIVDDLTRPTPADAILPSLLDELKLAGVATDSISIISATGTHGPATRDAISRKVGPVPDGLKLLAHDDLASTVRMGRTSFGSRIEVSPAVAAADLIIGLSGIFPQYSAGFGGGAKLVLGVLGRRSIEDLHFTHQREGEQTDVDNPFRRDVTEMARRVGLAFSIMTMVDADRRIVWMKCGDPYAFYGSAAEEARTMFTAGPPAQADVVISNAYPMDVSATFMRSKGIIPLRHARKEASRVLIAACSEGIGHHGLFPLRPSPGIGAQLTRLRRELRYRPGTVPLNVFRRVRRALRPADGVGSAAPSSRAILCFVTSPSTPLRSDDIPGMRVVTSWEEVLEAVALEQGASRELQVAVYPCSPLQVVRG